MNMFSLNTNITPIAVVGENLNKFAFKRKSLLGIILLKNSTETRRAERFVVGTHCNSAGR